MIAAALHILCLLPLTTQIMRRDPQRDVWLFMSIFVAAAGTVIVLGLTGEEVQSRGFTAALHWSELSVILIFGGLVICNGPKQIWRLAGYIGGYLLAFGGVAAVLTYLNLLRARRLQNRFFILAGFGFISERHL